nr:unnamed protein product [Callosobruchus chinensis]
MESNSDVCAVCKDNFIVSSKFVKCSLCHLKFHLVCVSMKDSWMRIVSECDNLSWFCDKCKFTIASRDELFEAEVNVLKKEIDCLKREQQLTSKILENLEYTNDLQKAVIKSYENRASTSSQVNPAPPSTKSGAMTFSEIVKRPPKCPALVIKSNDNSNTDVFQEVTKSVDPAQINVCISSTRRIKNGMVVHCEDENSLSRLKDSLNHKLGSKFTVSEPRKWNPRLLVKNVNLTNLPSAEAIIKDIVILNRLDEEQSSHLKFVTKLKHFQSTNIVIEVSPDLRNMFLKKGFIFIGWKKSPVSDHFRIVKCYRCCSYGHSDKNCQSDLVCPKCTRNHKLTDCNSDVLQCINCANYNKSYKKSLPIDHASNDDICFVYRNYLQNLKDRVNYD